jgi:hypothetical protein
MVMKDLQKLITSTLFILCFANQVQGSARAQVDRNEVGQNETFELSIELSEPATGQPDLSGFPKEIKILQSENFHHSSIIQGTARISSGWRIRMKATEPGIFTLPAIQIGGYETQPIQVKVLPASSSISLQTGNTNPSIFIEASVDKTQVVAQEQILYTIKIFSSVNTQYRTLTEPHIDNAMIESLGDLPGYERYINGTRYTVIDRKYAIFPQQVGSLTISPVTFSAEVTQGRSSRSIFSSFNSRSKPVTVTSDAIHIDVIDSQVQTNAWWLPANQVTLTGQWNPVTTEFTVGEPATLEIMLIAEGNSKAQLPEINLEKVSGLKWYVDNSIVDQKATADKGLIATRVERFAVVPTEAGEVTIPEITIPWYNTQTKQLENATIEAQTIKVKPSAKQTFQPLTTNTDTQQQKVVIKTEYQAGFWPWLTLLATTLWLFTLAWLVYSKRHHGKSPLFHQPDFEQKPIKITRLISVCKSNDPQRIHRELLDWCNFHMADYNIHSLNGLSKVIENQNFANALKELEAIVYGQKALDKVPDLVPFLDELQALAKAKKQHSKTEALPPLYKTN